MAGLVELARPCSSSGGVKVDTSSDKPQFLKAKVPVAESSTEVGLMMLYMLLWPGGREIKYHNSVVKSYWVKNLKRKIEHWPKNVSTQMSW